MKRILQLAAENAALPGAKVGGMADVLRDLPTALADENAVMDFILPDYGFLIRKTQAEHLHDFLVPYRNGLWKIGLFVTPHPHHKKSRIYLLAHEALSGESIYSDSGDRPFADDANKFSLYCIAVAELLKEQRLPMPDVIHLHDWHVGFFAILRSFIADYRQLRNIPVVMTIHNLALQGIRPLQYDDSSLEAWYPRQFQQLSGKALDQIRDPRYRDCLNPMRAAINLSDRVHVVSPTYAKEILKPSRPNQGFFGGEGLEQDLANKGRRLMGILNGCNYPKQTAEPVNMDFAGFCLSGLETIFRWQAKSRFLTGQNYVLEKRLKDMIAEDFKPDFIMTSVGRLTEQKVLILRQYLDDGRTVLQAVLERLSVFSDKALFILVGSGDAQLTAFCREHAVNHSNFLFFNGYDESLPDWVYRNGDLFLMPSSFEPCGISQMLAMREGQPCLVHGVGGLKDTVIDMKSGFVFGGNDLQQQGLELLDCLDRALATYGTPDWQRIRRSAKARRFSWQRSGREMAKRLYQLHK